MRCDKRQQELLESGITGVMKSGCDCVKLKNENVRLRSIINAHDIEYDKAIKTINRLERELRRANG